MDPTLKILKDTLERLYDKEDVETVLKNHKGEINFGIATKKLEELKENRKFKNKLGERTSASSSHMIVISSDSEDDSSDDATVTHPSILSPLSSSERRSQEYRTHPLSDIDHVETENFADYDMPEESDLVKWFKDNYETKFDAVVLKEDLFKHFCDHFKTPKYDELEILLFQKVNRILSDNSRRYEYVQCIDDTYFEGLNRVDLRPVSVTGAFQTMLGKQQEPSCVSDKAAKMKLTLHVSPKNSSDKTSTSALSAYNAIKKEKVSQKNVLAAKFPPKSHRSKSEDFQSASVTSQIQSMCKVPENKPVVSSSPVEFAHKATTHQNQAIAGTTRVKTEPSPTYENVQTSKYLHKQTLAPHAARALHKQTSKVVTDKRQEPVPMVNFFSLQRPSVSDTGFVHPRKADIAKRPDYSQTLNSLQKFAPSHITKTNFKQPAKADKIDERLVQHLSDKQLLELPSTDGDYNLRPIVIDGSNVACAHGNGRAFSCRGIALCVRYFWLRGHRSIICFVPNYRKAPGGVPPITGREVLFELEKMNICKFTPSRKVDGKFIVSYDDRYILSLAEKNDGIVVSNDQYRDLIDEKPEWKNIIVNSLLPYVFALDFFMPAEDPLGRNGPNLDDFLAFSHKVTQKIVDPYGAANSYNHIGSHKLSNNADNLSGDHAEERLNHLQNSLQRLSNAAVVTPKPIIAGSHDSNVVRPVAAPRTKSALSAGQRTDIPTQAHSVTARKLPVNSRQKAGAAKIIPGSTRPRTSNTIGDKLKVLFPGHDDKVDELVELYPQADDVNFLADCLLLDIERL